MTTNSTYLDAGTFTNGLFNQTSILGETLILQAIIFVIVAILITRKPSKWGEIGLPILAGLGCIGLSINAVLYTIAGIAFVVSILGADTIGVTLSSGAETLKNVFTSNGRVGEDKRQQKQAFKTAMQTQQNELRNREGYTKRKILTPWKTTKVEGTKMFDISNNMRELEKHEQGIQQMLRKESINRRYREPIWEMKKKQVKEGIMQKAYTEGIKKKWEKKRKELQRVDK